MTLTLIETRAERAATSCPRCGARQLPEEGSSGVVAWYTCVACAIHWSARLRDGRAVDIQPLL